VAPGGKKREEKEREREGGKTIDSGRTVVLKGGGQI